MGEEKRGTKRIGTKVIVNGMKTNDQYCVPDHFLSFTKDLSCQGARIICSKDIKPKDQFVLTLEIPTSFIPVLTFSEAVWVRKTDDSRGKKESTKNIEAGVRFLKLEPWDSEKLKRFLEVKERQFCQNLLEAEPAQSPYHIHSPLKRLKKFFVSV
jgi:hypothetical protein